MKFNLFDMVVVNLALPDFGIHSGMIGTIVDAYPDGEFEVEFCNDKGETLALVPLLASQIALPEIRKAA